MNRDVVWLVGAGLLTATSQVAYATQYLTQEQAQRAIFPEATEFQRTMVPLNEDQRDQIEAVSKTRTPLPESTIWQVYKGSEAIGWLVIDEVFGKHEFITYALGIDASGAVRQIEIMDYRETHGGEVRDAEWRHQFVGKKHGDRFKLQKDIENISGATLSCLHLAEGVRRLMALHEFALKSAG